MNKFLKLPPINLKEKNFLPQQKEPLEKEGKQK